MQARCVVREDRLETWYPAIPELPCLPLRSDLPLTRAEYSRESAGLNLRGADGRLGSARVSRAGFGVAPKQSFRWMLFTAGDKKSQRRFAIARTRSVRAGLAFARETRALPTFGPNAADLAKSLAGIPEVPGVSTKHRFADVPHWL